MSGKALYIGLMTGTSLDSVDCVLAHIDESGTQLLATRNESIPTNVRTQILALTQPGDGEIDRLGILDRSLGICYWRCVSNMLRQTQTPASAVTAIGCHGQTIRHRPHFDPAFTLQIGDPNTLAALSGISVVADFRRRDMVYGGQGAPLAPAFHKAVFSDSSEDRAIVNVGGISNITVLAVGRPTTGFDTGPGNLLMDAWIGRHLDLRYDNDGTWAAEGTVVETLLEAMLAHPFLAAAAPKSTGREDFNLAWLDELLGQFDTPIGARDVQATLLEFTAATISQTLDEELPDGGSIYLCGGGAHNGLLRQRLQSLLPNHQVSDTTQLGIAPDWVEAAAFAWLAYRTVNGLPGNLPAVTGASQETVLGAIFPAPASSEPDF